MDMGSQGSIGSLVRPKVVEDSSQYNLSRFVSRSAAVMRRTSMRFVDAGRRARPRRVALRQAGRIALMVSSVLEIASERHVTIEALADAKDSKGRRAIDVATATNRRLLWKRLFILGRYQQIKRLHQSNSSQVWQVEDKDATDEALKILALKQVSCDLSFATEMSMRTKHRFCEEFVVHLIREHTVDRILLMPNCECSLEHALYAENFAGRSVDYVRVTATQLVMALLHIHSLGVVHCDVKAKNICRLNGTWKLIDFDAAAPVGGMAGSKIAAGQMPANMPPELATCVFRANFPAGAIRDRLTDDGSLDSARTSWEACLAVVERLNQEQPGPTVCAISDVAPSFDMWGLGLIMYRLVTAFCMLNADAHDDLDEAQLRELVLWRGVSQSQLRKKAFAKAQPGAVASSEKDASVEAIAACLHPDPNGRPQSGQDLLKLRYFSVRGSGAMKAKLLFVSTPGKCFDHRTGLYDFDLMGWLQKLCRHFAGGFVVAYDWAGSSSTDARDKPWFDQIFKAADSDGRSLFQEWTEAPMEQKEGLIDRAERLLFETHWLASYKGSIKAQMRETCQSGAKAILLRFEGGPVTRVEARAMPVLVSECLADLAQLGVCNPVVELLAFETVYEFADAALFGVLGEIYGEHWDPIPPSLLAELKEAGPASAAGSRANSGARLSVEQAEHTQDSSACESHTVGSASQIAQVPTRTFRFGELCAACDSACACARG